MEEKDEIAYQKHADYLITNSKDNSSFEYYYLEHLKLSGIYWSLTALYLLGSHDKLDKKAVLDFVKKNQNSDGGFSGNTGHDSHILYTLSALQILAIYDSVDIIDKNKAVKYIQSLQQKDGSFYGDVWGEVDTRFSYCAFQSLSILGVLNQKTINIEKAVEFICKCRNFDGGFGSMPDAESHSGQIFCCVAALALVKKLEEVDAEELGWWLCERQLPCGGLNGRPDKKEDVCYSWWIMSSLKILGNLSWINQKKLIKFVLSCQDPEKGGISDRPEDRVDVYHTFFGLSALNLMGYGKLKDIDPVYALPCDVVDRITKIKK